MNTNSVPRILGIDPGLNISGYGVIEVISGKPRLREAGIIRGGTSQIPIGRRLHEIYTGVREVIESLQPTAIAIEQLYSHYEMPKTAILMGHARGVICLAAEEAKIDVQDFPATNIKKTLTGSGRAPKHQMQRAIQFELGLRELPEPADVADALAVALCYYYSILRPEIAIGQKR